MTEGGAYIYLSSADISGQALRAIQMVVGVTFAYFYTGQWDIYASISTANWNATMNSIQGTAGVSAVSPFQV